MLFQGLPPLRMTGKISSETVSELGSRSPLALNGLLCAPQCVEVRSLFSFNIRYQMRQVIQITGPAGALVALCDDGTLWCYSTETLSWAQLPPIPSSAVTDDRGDEPGPTDAMPMQDRIALERQERSQEARRNRFLGRS
jgi:hypothetical protein